MINNSQYSENVNSMPFGFGIASRPLSVSLTVDVGVFWQELENSLNSDPSWSHLRLGDAEIVREKMALIAQLRLPIPIEHLPAIAKIDDIDLQKLGERDVRRITRAVYLGEYGIVKEMLETGSLPTAASLSPNFYLINDLSLLDIALLRGHDDLVILLLSYWPEQEAININVSKALLASKSHLLPHLIETFSKNTSCRSPVHDAAMYGDIDALSFWMNAGANMNLPVGADASTPLDYAMAYEQLNAALFLMKGPIDPNCAILALAIKQGQSIECLRHLIFRGASLTARFDATPLCHAIFSNNDELITLIAGSIPNPGYYIQDLIDAWVKEGLSSGPAASGISKAIHCLIERLCPLTANASYNGMPLLHHLIVCCDESFALQLLEKGANPNTTTSSGISALSIAIIRNYQRLAQDLMRRGARFDADATDYAGFSPIFWSLQTSNTVNIAKQMFLQYPLSIHPELIYSLYKDLKISWLNDTVRQILTVDPDVHERWKERYLTKVCANIFGIIGDAILPATQPHIKPLIFSREGLSSPQKFISKIGNFVGKLAGVWPTELKECVYDLCAFASAGLDYSDEDYLARIESGEPTLILSHSWLHSWDALFYNGYLVICNFEGSIQFHRYDSKSLSEEQIASLRQCTNLIPTDQVANVILDLMLKLKVSQDESCTELNKTLAWVPDSIGNCTWKSLEGAISALLLLRKEKVGIIPWVRSLQLHLADRYISRHEKGQNLLYHPDEFLITQMIAKIGSTSYDFQAREIVQRGRLLVRNNQPSSQPYINPFEAHPINQELVDQLNMSQILHYAGAAPRIPKLAFSGCAMNIAG
ncbi:MAG: hypothetical protein Q8K75_00750 [Chlamydiales bacterium]|nr:hypothetical protein [Chlamydiales bacterium]